MEQSQTPREAAKFIVTNIADDDDETNISQKIAEVVLKPLLEGYISDKMKEKFKFEVDWFTKDYKAAELLDELD